MWPGALLLQHTHVHIQGDMKKRERETLHINNFVSFYICRQAEWIHFVRLSVSECFDTNGDRFWSLLSRAASCPVKKFQVRRELRTLSLSFTLSLTHAHTKEACDDNKEAWRVVDLSHVTTNRLQGGKFHSSVSHNRITDFHSLITPALKEGVQKALFLFVTP